MLFSEALELPEHARASWLEQQSGVDSETLAEVQSLLQAEERHRLLTVETSGQDGGDTSDLPEESTLRFGPYETVRASGQSFSRANWVRSFPVGIRLSLQLASTTSFRRSIRTYL